MKNTIFQIQNEENNNYETTLNDLISTKNELAKTTYNLNQREKDYNKLLHQFQAAEPKLRKVSETNEKLRNELGLQVQENKKLKNDNDELQRKVESLNEKYKKDFCSIKGNIESLYKNKIEREIQENFEYKVKQKEIEIKNLENKYETCEKEKNSLKYELNELKNEKEKEIYNLTNKYENENNILNKKIEEMIEKNNKNNNKNVDYNNMIINELKIENNNNRNEINRLNNILNQYKTQNNNLIVESNQRNKDKSDEIESLKFKINLQNNQIIDISTKLSMKDKQLINVQSQLDVITNTYRNSEKNNEYLLREKNALEKNYIEVQNELNMLKNLLNQREQEIEKEMAKISYENVPESFEVQLQQLKKLIEIRNEECDALNIKNKNIEEEKKLMNDKINELQKELEKSKNIFSDKDLKLRGNDMRKKDKDLKEIYEYLDKIKKENKIILKKKTYYKEQCKLYNQIIDVISKKLTKEQYNEIEKDPSFQKLKSIINKYKIENNNSLRENNIYDNTNSMSKGLINTNNSLSMNKEKLNNIMNNSSNNKENNYKNNNSNMKEINNNNNNNIFINNILDSNSNNNAYNNNNNIFNNKFNNNDINNVFDNTNITGNINNNINNKDKSKVNDNDEIPEDISYSESLAK